MELGPAVGAGPNRRVEHRVPPANPTPSTGPYTATVHPLHDPSHFMEESGDTAYNPRAPVSGASEQLPPYRLNDNTPTSTMDPNVPSSQSRPTALPTNPATDPMEQKEAMKSEHPAVIRREVEKTKAEEREIKGEAPLGTVIAGIEDDRLWAMLRRFDQTVTHVLHPAQKLPKTEPDLRPSTLPKLPSHSDVLKTNLERCIAAVGPSGVRGIREVQRLMSWSPEERQRTGTYCAAYFICWFFGYAMAGVLGFLVALICFPESRRHLFPPIPPPPFTPPSATDPTNQKGDESLLGHVDSKTVHRSKAEQAEEQAFEATSIMQAFTTRLIFDGRKKGKEAGNSAVGEKQDESSDDEKDGPLKDDRPQGMQSDEVVVGGETIIPKKELSEKERKEFAGREAKRKRDELVSQMVRATETSLGAVADLAERLTNTVSPPSAYPDRFARFKLAGAFLVPPMVLFTFVPAWIFARSATFGFGVAIWGQPLIIQGTKKFVELVPNWEDYMDMRNSILSGVPTDAQLTLHLLRVAEALKSPLPRPPPPPLAGSPKEAIKDSTPASMTAQDDKEVLEAEQEGGVKELATKAKHKTKGHIVSFFQKTGKRLAGVNGDVQVDGHVKTIGDKVDQFLFRGLVKDTKTLSSYPAKLDGNSGHIIIDMANDQLTFPQISFVPLTGKTATFVLPIDDIVELKKAHVSMTRLALGWVSGADVEGLGLTVRFKTVKQQVNESVGGMTVDGETMHFTRVGRREQLFVRLISMGRQRWEVL